MEIFIKAITFDFWNTLFVIPSDQCLSSKRIRDIGSVLKEVDLELPAEKVREAFKYGWQQAWFKQRAFGEEISPRGQVRYIIEKMGINISGEIEDKIYQVYTRALLQIPPLLNEGVRQTLPLLAEKFKLAVICNTGATPGAVLREIVANEGLEEFFTVMIFSDEVGIAKPSPRIFEYTLEHLTIENHAAAHIGDDPITDVIGAKKAGMTAVWLAPEKEWKVPEADYHVRCVNELLTLF
ncbi:MAG: HAD family hydrolase [Syntrophomonas sp.]